MTLRLLLVATACAAVAAPAAAREYNRAHPADISAAREAGCTVQQVHTPAGKTVQMPPLIHCPAPGPEVASSSADAPSPASGAVPTRTR